MKKETILFALIGILILSSCNEPPKKKVENDAPVKTEKKDTLQKIEKKDPPKKESIFIANRSFPKVNNLMKLAETDFVLTLEHELPTSKNSIYASSFLFAWEELRKIMPAPIVVDSSNSMDLKLLNQSNSYKGVLKKSEYKSTVSYLDGKVRVEVFFNKSLPFAAKFQTIDEGIAFGNKRVKAFGLIEPDSKISECIKILYYKDDKHFVIKLLPKDENHEIILAKGIKLTGSFSDLIKKTNQLIYVGINEMEDSENQWKYKLQQYDKLAIPVIKFNIETNYKTIENQIFYCENKSFTIDSAYQRTAFILDEYGAMVESIAILSGSDQLPDPKKLYFDTPFFIYLKRTNNKNPYFAMKVMNAELMIRK